MSAIAGINGDVWLSTSPSTALGSPESCTDTGDHIHYFASVHQAWDPSQPITVQNSPNGSTGWVTVTDYVFNWPVGEIVFNTVRTNTFTRIFAGNFFTISALDGAHAWKMSAKGMTKDVTPFQAAGAWAVNLGTVKSMTWNVDCYRQDARILTEMGATNISGGIVLCQLWFNEAGGMRWQFYAFPTGITQAIDAQDVDKQAITFQASGPVYFITSNTFSTTTVIQE